MPYDGSVEGSRGYSRDPCGRARACSVWVDRFKWTTSGRTSGSVGRPGPRALRTRGAPAYMSDIGPFCAVVLFLRLGFWAIFG